jgi:predicted metal-binding protein
VKNYTIGILVQTVGEIEDSLDWDGIMETGVRHKDNFGRMKTLLNEKHPSVFAMGAGECKVCEECTYPDNPCRFPDKMEISMEACGLFVSKVCTDNDLEYNYGSETIAFTSCFLI